MNVNEMKKKSAARCACVCVCLTVRARGAIAMFYLVNYSINLSEGKLNMK